MRWLLVFIFFTLLGFPAFNAGAEEITLNVDTAVSLALQNNLGLKADRTDLKIKERAMDTAWISPVRCRLNSSIGITWA